MPVRRIGATWVFPVFSPPIKNGVVEINEDGYILSLGSLSDSPFEKASTEFYNGILTPGFVNTHTHLELSWCRKIIPMHSGLPVFLARMASLPSPSPNQIASALSQALSEMLAEGIVAAGNVLGIESGISEFPAFPLQIHNFIELLDLPDSRTHAWEKGIHLYRALTQHGSSQKFPSSVSVSPHAPYTVSEKLFSMISSLAAEHHFPISIHNQETSSEDEFFRSGTGPLAQMLTKLHTARDDSFAGKPSSLQAYLPLLPRENNILLVHNTYTSEKDIEFALSLHPNLFWVLCPNANLYIENKLPPVEMLRRNHCSICLGTDSLASNNAISLLDELKTLSFFFPEISLHEALTWACHNGARALGMESILGSFEPGKQPGIVLIEYADHINLRLTPQAKARRIDIRNYHVSEPVS